MLRPPSLPPRVRQVVTELPWLVAVPVCLTLLWLWGEAFVLDGGMYGYGWHDYVNNAWIVEHGGGIGYNNFRNPLHAKWLGSLGESMGSYANAGRLIASISVLVMVLSAALLARSLAGPWAAALSALGVALVPRFVDAVRWSNYYPSLGALTGAYLALSAALVRWPRVWIAALAGLAGGLAWGVDDRGALLLPLAGVLVLLAASRRELTWPRRGALVVAFCVSLPLGPWSKDTLWPNVKNPTWEERVDFQRQVIRNWIRISKDDELIPACRGDLPEGLVASVQSPCGQALLLHNLRWTLGLNIPYGLLPAALALPLVLFPGRRGWREGLAGGAVFVGTGAAVGEMCFYMPMPDRYLIQFAVPFCAVVPVGLARASAMLPTRVALWVTPVLVIAAGAWAWVADPIGRGDDTKLQASPRQQEMRDVAEEVLARLGEADVYRDCTHHYATSAMLPRLTQPSPPLLRARSSEPCYEWMERATPEGGSVWLSVDPQKRLEPARQAGSGNVAKDLAQAEGWTLEFTQGSFQLWKRDD